MANKYEFDVLRSYYFQKYSDFVVIFDKNMNKDYYRRCIKILNDMFECFTDNDSWMREPVSTVPNYEDLYYLAFKRDVDRVEYDGWCNLGYLEDNRESSYRKYPRVFYPQDFDTPEKFISILQHGTPIPSYRPRKMDRTLEGVSNVEYDQVVFKTNNKEQYEYVLNYLFKNTSITWIGNDRDIAQVSRNYPVYLFVDFSKNNVSWGNDEDLGSIDEYIRTGNAEQSGDYQSFTNPHLFDYKDVDKLEHIKRGININVPNYQPRKIHRTLESYTMVKEGYIAEGHDTGDEFSIEIDSESNNEKIQRYLFSFGYRWHGEGEIVRPLDPGNILTCYKSGKELVWIEGLHRFNEFLQTGWRYNPKIYTMNEWGTFSRLVTDRHHVPDYSPRRMDRTLEGVNYWPYRFKTEEEFIEEYGDNWRYCADGFSFAPGMYYLLGTVLEYDFPEELDEIRIPRRNNPEDVWYISHKFLTDNPKRPDYSPRKMDRTLESITRQTKYNYVIFKFADQEEFTLGQEILKEHGFTWQSDRIVINDKDFPCYLFVQGMKGNHWDNKIYYDSQNDLNNGNPYHTIMYRVYGAEMDEICPDIFTVEDCHLVNRLFDYVKTPSYKPKKMNRTLESINERLEIIEDNNVARRQRTQPKFLIGDTVTFNSDSERINTKRISYVGGNESVNKFIRNNIGKQLTVDTLAYDPDGDLWVASVRSLERGNFEFVYQDALMYGVTPTYSPRRAERVSEAIDNRMYDTVVFEVLDEEQNERCQKDMFGMGYKWSRQEQTVKNFSESSDYPVYLFLDYGDKSITYMTNFSFSSGPYRNIHSYISHLMNEYNDKICTTVFKYNEVRYTDIILKTGMVAPSYKPRPRDRMMESFDYDRYMVYKKEFDKGNIWLYVKTHNINQTRNFYDMIKKSGKIHDVYLGQEIEDWGRSPVEGCSFYFGFRPEPSSNKLNVTSLIHDSSGIDQYPMWMMDISDREIIQKLFGIELEPSYKPRKIDRTMESNGGLLYTPMSIYCEGRENCMELEDMVHKLGWKYESGKESYLLQNYSFINEVTFYDFKNKEKTFNAYGGKRETINPQYIYPNDKGQIRQILAPPPDYRPKRMSRDI